MVFVASDVLGVGEGNSTEGGGGGTWGGRGREGMGVRSGF